MSNTSLSIAPYFLRTLRYTMMIYVFPVILLTTSFNIPRFFELETCMKINNTRVNNFSAQCVNSLESSCRPYVCSTALRRSFGYSRDYVLIANFLVMILIPLGILITLNWLIYKFIRQCTSNLVRTSSRQRRDQKVAFILTTIVIIFFCCNTPRTVINIYEVKLESIA